ncbi:thiaminase/transcriptional activator TenA [Cricetibacter osteomyelitidis]|uniref:Aminopyrimidine aminohydrolase n=1 Tax=Cricetibacter osteomyelitidis TaxID=1521931 RepID=A0A4V2T261_9PAST|nr:thiaminase II [Cricetibacter osteomyelitidis]TCP96223.1 thiaminase/transcriptional activator TenA [Cricetibacter osteomyelitidis]
MSFTQQLIAGSGSHWKAYVQHEFVQKLADGSLPKAGFQHYLKQDYLYLFQYSRIFALAIFKAENFAQMETAQKMLNAVLSEIQLHIDYCRSWGIDEKTLFATQESAACIAYTRYVLDCGMNGSLAELYAAVAPCALGYAEIGRWIADNRLSPPNNPYQSWIDMYASAEFQQSAVEMDSILDELCRDLTEKQLAKVQQIFTTTTRMEVGFWQMGLDCFL